MKNTIISISDIHGYLEESFSALEEVGEYPEIEKFVKYDDRLKWVGPEDYSLVFNGDMIDRGPQNSEVLENIFDLLDNNEENIVYNIGNHEVFAMFPDLYKDMNQVFNDQNVEDFQNDDNFWWNMGEDTRKDLIDKISQGQITVAYDGFNHQYVHAGSNTQFNTEELNSCLRDMGSRLKNAYDESRESFANEQEKILREVYEKGDETKSKILKSDEGRGKESGVLWLDFQHLKGSAPPQIIGHTTSKGEKSVSQNPQRKGNVININTIRDYINSDKRNKTISIMVERPEESFALNWDEGFQDVRRI